MTGGDEVRWRLARVTLRHFRGVAGEQTYAFEGRSGLLHGHNGVGKSTFALGLQWVLYGRFQPGVLANVQPALFLTPVQAKAKPCSGEVVLARGGERLVVTRDAGERTFTVANGGSSFCGAEAEARRDELLGLDMDTFVRAVLLQQGRIRGLLLDDPKERNRALDRLLGMDAVEHLLDATKPRPFGDAASEWREAIRAEQQALDGAEKLLQQQLEAAQRTARELGFTAKDLTPSGLAGRYAELSRDLVALAARYEVSVPALAACPGPAQAAAVAGAFAKAAKAVRVGAAPQKRLAPVQQAIATLLALRARLADAGKARSDASARLADLVASRGEARALEGARSEARDRIAALRRELKDAGDLRQLLDDAHGYVSRARPSRCPVCERDLPPGADLAARLRQRADAMASEGVARLKRELSAAEERLAAAEAALAELSAAAKEVEASGRAAARVGAEVASAVGGAVPEGKTPARLEEALRDREAERARLARAVEAMETEIEALERRQREVQVVLAPAVAKRDELARQEQRREDAKRRHAAREAKALGMERIAGQLEAIRKALLAAKQDLASELLDRAAPRAQALYRRLVRQPVFQGFDVQVTPKAAKVDYAFHVTTAAGAARDARLVLSDGQLTATAMALFFGLAESTAHALGFLCVDDPTQNLDGPRKEAMAKVVAEMAGRRQVIVATQDEDFVAFLEGEGFPRHAVVHHLVEWDGSPNVQTSLPAVDP